MKLQELIDNGTIAKRAEQRSAMLQPIPMRRLFPVIRHFVSALDCTGCGNVRTLYEQLE